MSDTPSPPDLLAALTDALHKQIPNAGDHVTRRVLRLYLQNTGYSISIEALIGALIVLVERGWIRINGDVCTTTAEGARAFAPVAVGLARRPPRT
jgi:hypothetical protein